MRLSDGRITHLSHLITDALARDDKIEFKDAWNNIRLSVRRSITGALREDEEIGRKVEARIRSLKRNVPEGGPEWEVLCRKYYSEEIERLRSIR